jgi:hypothetical protein
LRGWVKNDGFPSPTTGISSNGNFFSKSRGKNFAEMKHIETSMDSKHPWIPNIHGMSMA